MPRALTEKTLELNIMAELAHCGRLAGYRPYFIGFSQLEEIRNGVDGYFSAGSLIGFFQFKRGYPHLDFFTFYINNNAPHFNQHHTLCATNAATHACRYVFPLVGSNADVYMQRGHLLNYTTFLSPQLFDPLVPMNSRHRVRLYLDGTWKRYTEYEEGTWKNVFGKVPEQQAYDKQGPSPSYLFEMLDLPRLDEALKALSELKRKDLRKIFNQRSSFCMIFDR